MRRALTDQEMDMLLSQHSFGHLGCSSEDRPNVFPMAYVYHNGVIYGQTTTGMKVEIIRKNPFVCFQVEDVSDRGWKSVQCWGKFEELDFSELKGEEYTELAELLTRKLGSIQKHFGVDVQFAFEGTPRPVTIDGKTSTLFRIVVGERAGRCQES